MYAFHGLAFYNYFRIKRKTGKSEEEEEEELQKEGKKRRNGREREKGPWGKGREEAWTHSFHTKGHGKHHAS